MCGLYFFVHVVKYTIVAAKTTTLSSINGCNQNWMRLFTFHLHFSMKIILIVSCSRIYN
jgi:hypothetical protein